MADLEIGAPPARRPKYGNRKVQVGDEVFDSQREYRNHAMLMALQRAGVTRNVRHHVPFDLVVSGVKIARWTADHVYETREGDKWKLVVADSKSPVTRKLPAYRLKARLLKALFGHDVLEL